MSRKRLIVSLIFNAVSVAFVAFAMIASFAHFYFMVPQPRLTTKHLLLTFTGESNFVYGIAALLLVVCEVLVLSGKIKEIPKWAKAIKLFCLSYLTITFVVTAFYLCPNLGSEWWKLYTNSNLFLHFLNPVIAVISYFAVDRFGPFGWKVCLFSLIGMVAYETFYAIDAFTHANPNGSIPREYDIYGFARGGPVVFILLIFGFMAVVYGLTFGYDCLSRLKRKKD